jgi:diguanylate cyclase (GGDEF)-like protein
VSDRYFLAIANPLVAFIIALIFGLMWNRWRNYTQILPLAAAFTCLGLAFLTYETRFLAGPGEVSIPANVFFLATITLACSSALVRKKLPVPFLTYGAIFAIGSVPFLWFLLVEPSLENRVITIGLVMTGVIVLTLLKLLPTGGKNLADKLFIWAIVVAIVASLARPALVVIDLLPIESAEGFAGSAYWSSIRVFTPVMAFIVSVLFLAGMAMDIADYLRSQADRDYLTDLLNRRGFETAGSEALARDFAASRRPALMMADIDDFKRINDTFGHDTGDRVIAAVAATLAQHGRSVLAARIGGEEFALYYTDVSRVEMTALAEEIKKRLATVRVQGLPDGYPLTLSMGLHISYSVETLGDMLHQADSALYRAKEAGKNQAILTPVKLHIAAARE